MSEDEWIAYWQYLPNIKKMANEIVKVVSKRKIRLLACACCRRLSDSLTPETLKMLLLAEKHADKKANPVSLPSNQKAVSRLDRLSRAVYLAAYRHDNTEILIESVNCARSAKASSLSDDEFSEAMEIERAAQMALVREIFGSLPFRPIKLDRKWFNGTAVSIARGIYADKAFDRLPILADALEDSGCNDEDILAHVRQPTEHVRGCWAVDLILGRE